MTAGLYALLLLILAWMLYRQFAPVKNLRTLNARQFGKEIQGNALIDVREPHEYASGHIAGATNIPLGLLSQRLNEIPADQPVYLYCRGGVRSKQAARLLSRSGRTRIAHLAGGIMAWDGPVKK